MQIVGERRYKPNKKNPHKVSQFFVEASEYEINAMLQHNINKYVRILKWCEKDIANGGIGFRSESSYQYITNTTWRNSSASYNFRIETRKNPAIRYITIEGDFNKQFHIGIYYRNGDFKSYCYQPQHHECLHGLHIISKIDGKELRG